MLAFYVGPLRSEILFADDTGRIPTPFEIPERYRAERLDYDWLRVHKVHVYAGGAGLVGVGAAIGLAGGCTAETGKAVAGSSEASPRRPGTQWATTSSPNFAG